MSRVSGETEMISRDEHDIFKARLERPKQIGPDADWGFLVLPKSASDCLPRRGRITVDGTLNGVAFRETLEPDGQLSHWLKVGTQLREAAGANFGDFVAVGLAPLEVEPDPAVPEDFSSALQANPEAHLVWNSTTTLARLDWIHWMTSAKQGKTRAKRIAEACDKLASGKRRVCCFDPSGFYSKAFSSPKAAE
ncbi:YdeI/OmpD-associated family protein [Allohahella sp. A8]|uniref:YdeI/OmpD-associated family protein n=1 Tax=Allohahella sp. A8 TaxID=3141461 RepID=UPI003A7FD30B